MIQQQTFEIQDNKEELLMIAAVLEFLSRKQYTEAAAALIKRQDELTPREPKLKPYDPREART